MSGVFYSTDAGDWLIGAGYTRATSSEKVVTLEPRVGVTLTREHMECEIDRYEAQREVMA